MQGLFVSPKIDATVRGMEEQKRLRGRPRKPPEEVLVLRSIRLPAALWAKVDEHGMEWLRALIRKARPPKD
jgi:hypothetical protein